MPETITLQSLATQVQKVRNLQNKYFITRDKQVLIASKEQEKVLDKMASTILNP